MHEWNVLTQWKVVACLLRAHAVHAAGILCHSVVGEMYFLVYVYWCLQHPLIYKQVRYCNIYSIIWLANFQFKFYIREGGIHFFLYKRGWVIFLQFSSVGGH